MVGVWYGDVDERHGSGCEDSWEVAVTAVPSSCSHGRCGREGVPLEPSHDVQTRGRPTGPHKQRGDSVLPPRQEAAAQFLQRQGERRTNFCFLCIFTGKVTCRVE